MKPPPVRVTRSHASPGALRGEIAAPGLRVGLFGGSFNPVHEGHLHVAQTALTRLGLDRVWWLVSPQNPLKDSADTADYETRLEQVRAMAANPRFTVTDIERRLGTTTTVETLAALKRRHPTTRFVWIMGGDNLVSFHKWHQWTEIAALAPICVIARPGATISAGLSRTAQRFARHRLSQWAAKRAVELEPPVWVYVAARLHPASSTALRRSRISPLP